MDNPSHEALERFAAALKRRSHMRRQTSRFNGPLIGCKIKERHPSGKCPQCNRIRSHNWRRWGVTVVD